MLHRLPADDPSVWIVLQKRREQVRRLVAPQRAHGDEVRDRPLPPLRELGVIVRQPVHAVPVRVRVRSSPPLKDLDQLVDIAPSRKERQAGGHLGKDAADAPYVNCRGIPRRAEEEFRGSVPQGDDLVSVRSVGQARETGESEVGELQGLPVRAYQKLFPYFTALIIPSHA
ncbi:hypothetical protein THAOC_20346 [Thalassiosira oceanica]|uniref:Uncharacterized protein n=1 Tax=Thalassiosira oceanica TaxID=159749 RepID=K0S2F7_THAOC|nr:hypothetical protein THAOC_20346 [Thalassiosira oceanica]|eukprot:EJK59435.1 hypothetical protein THAOC_20346 [Thalassiosira oceanica]